MATVILHVIYYKQHSSDLPIHPYVSQMLC